MHKAVFLDRDGVINDIFYDMTGKHRSPRSFAEFRFVDGIQEVVKELSNRGYKTVVVSNQPEVKRGLLNGTELDKMTDLLRKELPLTDVRICLHDHDDHCECRKPAPGMILSAAKEHDIDLKSSFMVGDTIRDVEAGGRAGCKTVLVNAPYNEGVEPDIRINSIRELLKHCP